MNAPRWFYVIVAASAVVLSASVAYRMLRPPDEWVAYHMALDDPNGTWLLNTRTHQVCLWRLGTQGSRCFNALNADSTHR